MIKNEEQQWQQNCIMYSFSDDKEKMIDFGILTKNEFLQSYSYLTEKEYNATYWDVNIKQPLDAFESVLKSYHQLNREIDLLNENYGKTVNIEMVEKAIELLGFEVQSRIRYAEHSFIVDVMDGNSYLTIQKKEDEKAKVDDFCEVHSFDEDHTEIGGFNIEEIKERIEELKMMKLALQLGYDSEYLNDLKEEQFTCEELRQATETWGSDAVAWVVHEGHPKEDVLKGYDVFIDGQTGAKVIMQIDALIVAARDDGYEIPFEKEGYTGDFAAAKVAEQDGYEIAWDLVDKMQQTGYEPEPYLDTEENRTLIEGILKEKEIHAKNGSFQR